jgi:RNA polymerase sigma-70 factor, ECF subfamily
VDGITEQQLLKSARRLDPDALTEVYDRYSEEIFRYAYRQSGSQQLAEDCVSETFTRFLSALEGNKGPRDYIRAYLYRTAHNWLTDQFRKQQPEIEVDQNDLPLKSGEKKIDDQIVHQEQVAYLRQHIQRLTPAQRQVIVLKYLEQMDNAEIAKIVGKSVGSVKALHSRGLENLRKWIE